MAGLSIRGGKKNIVFKHDNDWNTPKYAFDDIQHLIPVNIYKNWVLRQNITT